MSTYVVETVGGTWAMDCCDEMHSLTEVMFAEFSTRADAERAAKEHRADDRRERAAYEARIAQCCSMCGRAR